MPGSSTAATSTARDGRGGSRLRTTDEAAARAASTSAAAVSSIAVRATTLNPRAAILIVTTTEPQQAAAATRARTGTRELPGVGLTARPDRQDSAPGGRRRGRTGGRRARRLRRPASGRRASPRPRPSAPAARRRRGRLPDERRERGGGCSRAPGRPLHGHRDPVRQAEGDGPDEIDQAIIHVGDVTRQLTESVIRHLPYRAPHEVEDAA